MRRTFSKGILVLALILSATILLSSCSTEDKETDVTTTLLTTTEISSTTTKPNLSNPYIALSIEDKESYLVLLRIVGEYFTNSAIAQETFEEMQEIENLSDLVEEVIKYKNHNNSVSPELEESFNLFFSNGNDLTGYPKVNEALAKSFDLKYDVLKKYWTIALKQKSKTKTSKTSTSTTNVVTTDTKKSDKTNIEWKQFLKDYEKWVDDYVVLVKKYNDNPLDMSLLSDYTNSMVKMAEWAEKADKIELELSDTPEALAEYLTTLSRIINKLSGIV